MSKQNKQTGDAGVLGPAMFAALAGWGAHWLWRYSFGDPVMQSGAALAALFAVMQGWHAFIAVCYWLDNFRRFLRAVGEDASRGTAAWLSEKEARAVGLHRLWSDWHWRSWWRLPRRLHGLRLGGVIGNTAFFLWTETHSLIIGPAGSSKSTAAILPMLCQDGTPALVNDTKGELLAQTGGLRARKFGHRIVEINPLAPDRSVKINPIDLVADQIEADDPGALTSAKGMALQLCPDPKGGSGQNQFFYIGARLLIATLLLVVAAVCIPERRTLATVYRALSDMEFLHELLMQAASVTALNGEIAQMAESTHRAAFGEDGAAKTFEQFRLGAANAMEAFGPGNYLAQITSETTFDFADLKTDKVTAYLVIDYANLEVLGAFSGLMQWMATKKLVAAQTNQPVNLILDEFTNAPMHELPKVLTLLRSYGCKCTLATQDIGEIERVYGKDAKETILSETDIKQFLGGIRSQSTLEYLSKYLGEYSQSASNYTFGEEHIGESLSRTNRRLLNEDELRRLDTGSQIILKSNLRPILCSKVPVFAIAPYRHQIAPNRMYSKRQKYLPVQLEIGFWGAKVTRAGRFRLWRPSRLWPVLRYLFWSLLPATPLVFMSALTLIVYLLGVPHLRVSYAYVGAHENPAYYTRCDYAGLWPRTLTGPRDCPLIRFEKHW